ncbi:MAG: heavy metal translocating P-type ATPase [Nitrospinota bacterium]
MGLYGTDDIDSTTACFHCKLPVPHNPPTFKLDGEVRLFCCRGCLAVAIAIYDANLEEYYSHNEGPLAPPPKFNEEIKSYDLKEVQREFVTELESGMSEAPFLVEGIHCAACCWIIDRALKQLPQIKNVQINLARKRLNIVWNSKEIKVSQIMLALAKVGYIVIPFTEHKEEEHFKHTSRIALYRIGFAAFASMNIMWLSLALWFGADVDKFRTFIMYSSFVLATPVLFYSGWPFLVGGYRGLIRFSPTMDLPIAIGALVTYFYSIFVMIGGAPEATTYFETVVTLIFLISIGRFLDLATRRKAGDATIRLAKLQPKSVYVINDDGVEEVVAIGSVLVGTKISIKPGERIGLDGVVVDGESYVDESIITGENRPILKVVGDQVIAGSINQDGALKVKSSSTASQNKVAQLSKLILNAQGSRSNSERIADMVVPYFVVITITVATAAYIYWILHGDSDLALIAAVSTLIITCPCALGLATPITIAAAVGAGVKNGIIIREGEAIENLPLVDQMLFDKTGAITEGDMKVEKIKSHDTKYSQDEILKLALSVESSSEHPIGKALVKYGKLRLIEESKVGSFNNLAGYGVEGQIDNQQVLLGAKRLFIKRGIKLTELKENHDGQVVYLAVENRHIATMLLSDQIREDAALTLQSLKDLSIKYQLVTGDRREAALKIESTLGGFEDLSYDMTPEAKVDKLTTLIELAVKNKGGKVAMVGDGINDAAAIAKADVGIVMDTGADLSIAVAGITLCGGKLYKLIDTIRLSKKVVKIIRQNIAISILYNLCFVPVAVCGYLSPTIAAIAMPLSSLAVVGNAMRVRQIR